VAGGRPTPPIAAVKTFTPHTGGWRLTRHKPPAVFGGNSEESAKLWGIAAAFSSGWGTFAAIETIL
ncbi:MAG: hypothetical protein AAGN35_00385, partial [Bacteroidota bacterium]